MKVSELTGAELDYWVAKAEGVDVAFEQVCCGCGQQTSFNDPPECCGLPDVVLALDDSMFPVNEWKPSQNWAQGGPIIEQEGICIEREDHDGAEWYAQIPKWANGPAWQQATGKTPLIAAMRAYVASKHGEEVPEIVK